MTNATFYATIGGVTIPGYPKVSYIPRGCNFLKVFNLLMNEGKCQASIAKILGLNKSTVSRYVKWLKREGFIEETENPDKIKLVGTHYKKTPKASYLDAKLMSETGHFNDIVVTPCSAKRDNITAVLTHHLKYNFEIYKEGDYNWVSKETNIHNNTQSLNGKFQISQGEATVTVFITYRDGELNGEPCKIPKKTVLWMYPPSFSHIPDGSDPDAYKRIGAKLCMEAVKQLKDMGWELGEPVISEKWKPHHAVDLPALAGHADKQTVSIGTTYTSNSDGATEYESNEITDVISFLSAGRRINQLEQKQDIITAEVIEQDKKIDGVTARISDCEENIVDVVAENSRLRTELNETKTELDEARAEIRELKAAREAHEITVKPFSHIPDKNHQPANAPLPYSLYHPTFYWR